MGCAAILLLNAARRGSLIPDDLAVTHALAPLAEALGGVLPTAVFPPGLLVMAVGVGLLGLTLVRRAPALDEGRGGRVTTYAP
ncbi:hypothetical protein ACFW7J_25285 [Streptomyces sp. NPDC059525]|uniref:hypothetical protein n=1 Tax=Streptomyces sp. NPDC059525 TaxID=3346857 RepID=UPI0036798045